MMNNRTLNTFYEEKVKMFREETKANTEIVLPIVKNILKYVNDKDKRFRTQTLDVGSYHTHLKVSKADEFDFSVVMDLHVPPLSWVEKQYPSYYWLNEQTVPSSIPPDHCTVALYDNTIEYWDMLGLNQGSGCLTKDRFLIPIKVKEHFESLVEKAVQKLEPNPTVRVSKITDSPATKLAIDISSTGYTVHVDLCPIIECKVKVLNKFGFPHSGTTFPSNEKIESILNHGVNLIAKDKGHWTLSFAVCEKELLKDIDKDGGCRRKCQRIMKKLKEDIWCPKHMKQELTSYHLKNTLFWECEDHSLPRDWSSDNLSTRLESMTKRLLEFLGKGELPLYFYPDVNLLKTKDTKEIEKIAERIIKFLRCRNPRIYLHVD